MSFRDFHDEGPGTVEWDVVLGENTTGLFPDEVRYEMVDGELKEVLYRHTGGGKYEPVPFEERIASSLKETDIKVAEGTMKYYTADEVCSKLDAVLDKENSDN